MLAVAWPAQANVFSSTGADPRMEIERGAYPYSSVGYVETIDPVPWVSGPTRLSTLVAGTGFMISPCYALTAYHVVFGNDPASGETALKHPVWISLGGNDTGFALTRLPAMAVAWGDFAHNQAQDWALLEVVGCPGGRPEVRWMEFKSASASIENRPALVAGFDAEFLPYRLMGQTGCWLGQRVDPITIRNFCASRPGMSGAPIMVREPDHIIKAIAMVSREQQASARPLVGKAPERANLAVVVQTALSGSPFFPKILVDRASGDALPIPTR
jgi:hypothetical protein